MPRPDANRFADMEAFAQVAERGSLSAAARHLGMSPSALSKLLTRLEARLGVRLVQRSTRQLQLTAEGVQFHERSRRVLADLDEAERSVAAGAPRGRVSINASNSFGHRALLPLVPALTAQWPELVLDITLTDRVVDLMEARADIAVRWGPLPASSLVARPLGETPQAVVASPAFLARHGTPARPEDLLALNRLGWNYRRAQPAWPFRVRGRLVEIAEQGNVRAGDGETLRHLALLGHGLARLSMYHVGDDLRAGRLVKVLERFNPGDTAPLHAVYQGRPDRLPARVRAVLDYLSAHVDIAALGEGR
ncbi:LysR family transcriptional regulator [Ramlibacter sp.]|uniref:LysR family transcriptional regulator n=1 Tax=Ramlibacter sp. TaxID=1917967 RepID=UPI0017C33A5E|nr:LysR family transcriptional regulator [Ramlibacter sp.]MBA2675879.1 LysR family transcriptional regulator [Ramlibacter sp.]